MSTDKLFLALAILVLAVKTLPLVYELITSPKKVKEWLLYAVIEAEKEFGSGTGKLKLRSVYDAFIIRFPKLAALISFNSFSKLVDIVLKEMEKLLYSNVKVEDYIITKG